MLRSTAPISNTWKRLSAPSATPTPRGAAPKKTPKASPADALTRKAWRQANSTALAAGLARITPNAQMRKQYERTRDTCGKHILQADGKLEASYCRNRWCHTCMSHRVAAIWAAYGDQLQHWDDAYFVTLTVPNCAGIALRSTLRAMHHGYSLSIRQLRKKGHTVAAIRQTECTANAQARTYHPHLHVLIRGYAAATALLSAWLKRHPEATALAQDIRKADENSLRELVKYLAKVSSTEPREDGTQAAVPWDMLDTIYTAMRGMRLFVGHGIRAATPADADGEANLEVEAEAVAYTATKRPTERITWTWEQSVRDWIDRETGELLTEFEPNEKQKRWLAYMEAEPPPHVRAVHAAHKHTSTAALAA